MKATVSGVLEDLKFKISEGSDQNWSCPESALLAVSVYIPTWFFSCRTLWFFSCWTLWWIRILLGWTAKAESKKAANYYYLDPVGSHGWTWSVLYFKSLSVWCPYDSLPVQFLLIWCLLHKVDLGPELKSKHLKSDNLQYDTLGRWVTGTNDSLTKCLMFQVLFVFS